MFKKLQLITQLVGFATLVVLAIYGLVALLGGGSALAAALDSIRAAGANPAIPATFNYQGFLRNPDGTLATGTYTITAKIYDAPTAGSVLYTETFPGIAVRDGLFNIVLGDNPQGQQSLQTVFSATPRYIGITLVGRGGELIPRQRVHGVPWAFYATNATNATNAADFTATGTITATNIGWTGHLQNMVVEPEQTFYHEVSSNVTDKIADAGNRICWLSGYDTWHNNVNTTKQVELSCWITHDTGGWFMHMNLQSDGVQGYARCQATCLRW